MSSEEYTCTAGPEFPFLDDKILQFWHSIIAIVASNKKISHLVVALVTRLSKMSDCKQTVTADVILGWINAICSAVFQSGDTREKKGMVHWFLPSITEVSY